MRRLAQWLVPGLRLKRWVALGIFGFLLAVAGFSSWLSLQRMMNLPPTLALAGGCLGVVLVFVAMRSTFYTLFSVLGSPMHSGDITKNYLRRRTLSAGPHIVVLGGGTGLPVVLRGLKPYTANLTAIVTSADDGGSSGRLRTELGILPPGDARNCLLALAETEPLLERLFQYRFGQGLGLEGHAFGNLFIAAMAGITGDFQEAVQESSRVLAVRGKVLTATVEPVHLVAQFEGGQTLWGESAITQAGQRIAKVSLAPDRAEANQAAVESIEAADGIIIAPGSLFTSILPVLMVRPVADALRRTHAMRLYIQNLMTQPGETDGMDAPEHLEAIERHVGQGLIDAVLASDTPIDPEVARRYAEDGAHVVGTERQRLEQMGYRVEERDLASVSEFIRHDSDKVGQAALELIIAGARPRDPRKRLELFWLAQGLKGGA